MKKISSKVQKKYDMFNSPIKFGFLFYSIELLFYLITGVIFLFSSNILLAGAMVFAGGFIVWGWATSLEKETNPGLTKTVQGIVLIIGAVIIIAVIIAMILMEIFK